MAAYTVKVMLRVGERSPDGAGPGRLDEHAYDELLRRITFLEIPPGSRISIDALSRELRLSKTPIREALGRLESDGLVYKLHLSGYRASDLLNRDQFEDLAEFRSALEPIAAERAASRIKPEGLERLRSAADAMAAAVDDPEDPRAAFIRFSRADAEFHDVIASVSGNVVIRESLHRWHIHAHLFRLYYHSRVTQEAITEHAAILAALEQHQPETARLAMAEHIRISSERTRSAFQE
jgi:DNA-binding GntR family transcriptional regulator